jgi:hypothetical protein
LKLVLTLLTVFHLSLSYGQTDTLQLDSLKQKVKQLNEDLKVELRALDSLLSVSGPKLDSLNSDLNRLRDIFNHSKLGIDSIERALARPYPDSVQQFIDQVGKVELVKLIPHCYKRKVFIDSLNRKKKLTFCRTQSAIESNIVDSAWVFTLNEKVIGERKELKDEYRAKLFRAIFPAKASNSMTMCYEPRHGVYFYGEDDKFLGFFEICFECSRSEATSGVPVHYLLPADSFQEMHRIFDEHDLLDLKK